MRHTGQESAHGSQLLTLEKRCLLVLRLGYGALALHGPAELRAHLRQGLQQGGIRCPPLGVIKLDTPTTSGPTGAGWQSR